MYSPQGCSACSTGKQSTVEQKFSIILQTALMTATIHSARAVNYGLALAGFDPGAKAIFAIHRWLDSFRSTILALSLSISQLQN